MPSTIAAQDMARTMLRLSPGVVSARPPVVRPTHVGAPRVPHGICRRSAFGVASGESDPVRTNAERKPSMPEVTPADAVKRLAEEVRAMEPRRPQALRRRDGRL